MFRILQIALLFSAVIAFNVMQPVSMRQTTACNLIMTDEEVETILSKATDCMGEECSVDEVDELLVLLKDTQKSLESRMDTVMNMISDLQHLNGQEERQVDEVKALVKDMLRVFAHDKNPAFNPMGFSGEIGDGPKTAYDVLSPKKWTPTE